MEKWQEQLQERIDRSASIAALYFTGDDWRQTLRIGASKTSELSEQIARMSGNASFGRSAQP